jgi:hypothetical protein
MYMVFSHNWILDYLTFPLSGLQYICAYHMLNMLLTPAVLPDMRNINNNVYALMYVHNSLCPTAHILPLLLLNHTKNTSFRGVGLYVYFYIYLLSTHGKAARPLCSLPCL